jgi:hypothetical protein
MTAADRTAAGGASAASADAEHAAYDELCLYTLAHGDATFIHQHVVDAFMVQHADESTKPIGLIFGLLGLYLKVERGCTGRQVQQMHMLLARRKREWPRVTLPQERGALTVLDVMQAPPGPERDRAIDAWCAAVWAPWQGSRDVLAGLLEG